MKQAALPIPTPPFVLFSLFQLRRGNRFWAFKKMGLSFLQLRNSKQMPFGLMLGSGKGFGLDPNFDRYALLTSWHSPEDAVGFLENDPFSTQLHEKSKEVWSVLMHPVVSKGAWGGKNPFLPLAEPLSPDEPLIALTRATIRPLRMIEFWQQVPPVSDSTDTAPGLLAKIGIGEWPVIQQATFSVWENTQALQDFAYRMQAHKAIIGKTRQRNWYSEELFARFRPLWMQGSWGGSEILPLLARPNLLSK